MSRHRVTIERGIARDEYGFAAYVSAHRHRREKRFPPETSLTAIRSWRRRAISDLEKLPTASTRGTLNHDADRYLERIRARKSAADAAVELKPWRALYGSWRRAKVAEVQVREAVARWKEQTPRPVAPKTINHRLHRLRNLYHVLDGPDAPTPVDHVELETVPKSIPIAVSPELIRSVEAKLREKEAKGRPPDAKTRARFMVLASTGKRASELMRAEAPDVDLERRVWVVKDGKGGFSPGVWLNDDMLAAWSLFIAAEAWGPFSTSAFARILRRCGWPAGVRPYQLRHAVGIALSDQGEDLADIAAHMGHRDIRTTRGFYVPVLGSRLEAASRRLNGRLGWAVRQDGTAAPGTKPTQ